MPVPYVPPELTRYSIVVGVGDAGAQCVSPQNSSAECQCDCIGGGGCTNVGPIILTGCQNDGPAGSSCTTCDGHTCQPV